MEIFKTLNSRNFCIYWCNDLKRAQIFKNGVIYIVLKFCPKNRLFKFLMTSLQTMNRNNRQWPNHSPLSFRHFEMFWHTQEIIRETQLRFVFLTFLFVCQNISACLQLNTPRLVIVHRYVNKWNQSMKTNCNHGLLRAWNTEDECRSIDVVCWYEREFWNSVQ